MMMIDVLVLLIVFSDMMIHHDAESLGSLSALKAELKNARKNTTLFRAPITTLTIFIVGSHIHP